MAGGGGLGSILWLAFCISVCLVFSFLACTMTTDEAVSSNW